MFFVHLVLHETYESPQEPKFILFSYVSSVSSEYSNSSVSYEQKHSKSCGSKRTEDYKYASAYYRSYEEKCVKHSSLSHMELEEFCILLQKERYKKKEVRITYGSEDPVFLCGFSGKFLFVNKKVLSIFAHMSLNYEFFGVSLLIGFGFLGLCPFSPSNGLLIFLRVRIGLRYSSMNLIALIELTLQGMNEVQESISQVEPSIA